MNDTTRKQILPYEFSLIIHPEREPRIRIINTRGQTLVVGRAEIERQLGREDLDPHRRRMYEAALDALDKESDK